jgi:hypothetical protein
MVAVPPDGPEDHDPGNRTREFDVQSWHHGLFDPAICFGIKTSFAQQASHFFARTRLAWLNENHIYVFPHLHTA